MSSSTTTKARSLYRRLIRELPARQPSILANPSPLQKHIRADFDSPSSSSSSLSSPSFDTSNSSSIDLQISKPTERRFEEAEQYIHYLRAQRTYLALLERYNPGMNMVEEERVRLTARRVGMEMPIDGPLPGGFGGGGKKGN